MGNERNVWEQRRNMAALTLSRQQAERFEQMKNKRRNRSKPRISPEKIKYVKELLKNEYGIKYISRTARCAEQTVRSISRGEYDDLI